MMNITKLSNGILFDLSARPGAGTTTAKFIFRPSLFHTITRVEVLDDRMSYVTAEGQDYNFSFNGSQFTQLVADGLAASDNYDLFNKFIAKL